MSWVKLKTLYGERFRSYVDRFDVVFPESGLTSVAGRNLDTGDTSDSGKSTILIGLAHLFGGATFPATELQSWHDDKPFLLGSTFETSEGLVKLERHKQLVLTRGGEKFRGKAADEELDRLFGMDAKLRGAATYRGQGSDGLLLSLSDQEKKANLAKLVPDLVVYEKVAAAAALRAKSLQDDVTRAERAVAEATGALEAAEKMVVEAQDVADNVVVPDSLVSMDSAEIVVRSLRTSVDSAQQGVDAVASKVASQHSDALAQITRMTQAARAGMGTTTPEIQTAEMKLAEMRRRFGLVQQHDSERRTEIEKARAAFRVGIAGFDATAKQLADAESRCREIQADLDRQACDRCKQSIPPESPANAEVNKELQRALSRVETCRQAALHATEMRESLAATPEFEPHEFVAKLSAAVQIAEAELASARDRRDVADRKLLNDLSDRHRTILAEIAAETSVQSDAAKHVLASFKAKLADAEQYVKSLAALHADRNRAVATKIAAEATVTRVNAAVAKRRANLAEHETSLKAVRDALALECDVAAAVGKTGFLGAMVQGVLNEVADGTNEILAGVANVREVVFRFDHDDDRITPVVVVDGEARPLRSGLSGGMASVVNLAVDLAYGAAVAKRRGTYPGWISLDESFGGLGTVSLETVLEMLEKYAAGRLVLCIDHSSEFSGQFTQMIKTETSGRRSRIVV